MTRRLHVIAGVAVWVALIASWFVYQRVSGLGPIDAGQQLIDAAKGNWWAVAAFFAVSMLRAVVMFPATILTVAAGILFGPVVGTAVAVVAANSSAMLAYGIGRSLRRPEADAEMNAELGGWTRTLQGNGFEAVLLARLLFLPYDLVSYACGALRVPWRQFLAANAIGILPGTVAFVLVGASITRLDEGIDGVDRRTLAVSVVLVVGGIVVSRVIKRRRAAAPAVGRKS